MNWSGRPEVDVNADYRATLNFQNVNANDITDRMTIRVATVNGTAAETAARNGVLQIRTITRNEFDRNYRYRFEKGEIKGFTNDAAQEAEIIIYREKVEVNYGSRGHGYEPKSELIIPDNIWGDPVVSIGVRAFYGKNLTHVTIPNSVRRIGNFAFVQGNGLNWILRLTIGANVDVGWGFLGFFEEEYNKNGRKAGAYISRGGGWRYSP